MKTTFILSAIIIFRTISVIAQDPEQISDIDGNRYGIITIGNQIWMAENLRVTRFNNGDTIPTTLPVDLDITNESEPVYQWYYNGDRENLENFGRLYTMFVIKDERNVCPEGWHIPSKDEWKILIEHLGKTELENNMAGIASKSGDKLKESGTKHWKTPVSKATNKSGFTALPGGSRSGNGKFHHIGTTSNFWSSTIGKKSYWVFRITNDAGEIFWYNEGISSIAYSARCIKN